MVLNAQRRRNYKKIRHLKGMTVNGKKISIHDCFKVDGRRRMAFCFARSSTGEFLIDREKGSIKTIILRGRIRLYYKGT